MGFLRGILVKSESTSRLTMKRLLSWCTISSAKAKESLISDSNRQNYRPKWQTNMSDSFMCLTKPILRLVALIFLY